jgi:hypothetical protein
MGAISRKWSASVIGRTGVSAVGMSVPPILSSALAGRSVMCRYWFEFKPAGARDFLMRVRLAGQTNMQKWAYVRQKAE